MRKRLRSPRGLAAVHTPEGMPLPPKILVCAAIVKIRDEHRLRGSCATERGSDFPGLSVRGDQVNRDRQNVHAGQTGFNGFTLSIVWRYRQGIG